jgi:cellulose synthase/poly-beta-1,6-N-acetylglucosamine synthase-like glycosyltransferase
MGHSIGVIVPCRNEALVIARKLRNLALCQWPASEKPHRIVVVDDGSTDATREVALAELHRFDAARVRVEVVANAIRPGKSGAIEQGLAALGCDVDLIVLTDADVVIAPDALVELARAFEREPRLGMATGSQRFVDSLCDAGLLRSLFGGECIGANTLYDWLTARVRALESRSGLVFSVHGQLMAWRRELALVPTPGIAADDLDLMLQVRTRGLRIEWVKRARFFEVRPTTHDERELQAFRRARAYVQFRKQPGVRNLTSCGSRRARLQAWGYLHVETVWAATALSLCAAWIASTHLFDFWVQVAVIVPAALLAVLVMTSYSMRWLHDAIRKERRSTLEDRWETARR